MIRHRASRGASAVMILLVMALVLVGFFATYTLSRISGAGDTSADTQKRLVVAASALERYAATNSRLPCPADPATNAGIEVQASASTCTYGEGTLPWLTLGLNDDASFDGWGHKISYRVYTGSAGSLTQPGGVSMVECDTVELSPSAATPAAGSLGGLCASNADPYMRSTTPENFLAGKGLRLTDFGVSHTDVAYVLISHGATGLGAYTVAGTRMDMPVGAESNNTQASPAGAGFTIKAFSDPDTSATNAQHFDDLLAYATIPDLIKRGGLYARNWLDHVAASVSFDRPTLTAALGADPGTATDTGRSTIAFTNVGVTALDASGNAQNISFDDSGANQGLGGVANGTDVSSGTGGPDEALRLDFGERTRQLAFALDGFGYQATFFGFPIWIERVKVDFYDVVGTTATLKASVTKSGCHSASGMATFSVDADAFRVDPLIPADFNRVVLTPQPTTPFFATNASNFFLAEIKACDATVTPCATSVQTAANLCP